MSESKKKTILVADDSTSIRHLVSTILKKAGYDVLTASDGREALKLAFDNNIDAIVADFEMPNLDGAGLFRILRTDPEKGKLPRIMLSGLTEENIDKPELNSADLFIKKDGDLNENLQTALEKLL